MTEKSAQSLFAKRLPGYPKALGFCVVFLWESFLRFDLCITLFLPACRAAVLIMSLDYLLINATVAHDGPVRCISLGPGENEIVTGCQSDAPNLRRWRISADFLTLEEIGTPIYHDHWVTAVTSRKPSDCLARFPQVGSYCC